MKLVFIGGRGIHLLGGIENYMLNLTRELSKSGHECIVWCESDHLEEEIMDGVRVIYHPGPKSNVLCKPWCGLKATIISILKEKNISVIHYNAWPPSLWCWIPRMFGIPSLMEGHGLEWQRTKYSSTARKVMKYMERLTARLNHHLIMCSEGQVRFFKENYGVDSVCIPGAVNLPNLDKECSSDILERFQLKKGKYFLFLGRLVQDKNPDYLIKAFIRFNCTQHNDDYKLVIAGANSTQPEYVESLHKLASRCHNIIFTGAVYDDDKAQLLKNAYCFCIPSTIEGLSIVLMEAASYKLPVIASNIDANKEFLGENAIFVEPESVDDLVKALDTAVIMPELLLSQIKNNYQNLIDNYTWDKVADKYIKYLRSIGCH